MRGAAHNKVQQSGSIVVVALPLQPHRDSATEILSGASFQVITAGTVDEAFEQIGSQSADVILLNSPEDCRKVKADPRTADVPILFVIAESERHGGRLGAGAADYVTVPFEANILLARVRAHAELKKAREALTQYGERLRQINQEKNDFLSVVAHDLRSPLSNIVSSASIALTDLEMTREQLNEFLGIIQTSAEHLIHLVENLTDVNAIEQGRMKIHIQPCDLAEIAGTAAGNYESKAKAKEQQIVVSEGTGPLIAMADPHPMMQVFDNLISNAIKYSPKGKRIDIRVTRGNGVIRCEIQDEGPGLTAEDLKKVFGKFARLSARPTGGEPSTGLGLSIVQKIVEATGGKVWCETPPGKGAVFIVELPAATEV